MKYLYTFFYCSFCFLSAHAQSGFDLGFSISNQGQVDKELDEFYFPADAGAFKDDLRLAKEFHLKYNGNLAYRTKSNNEIRVRFGYGVRNQEYERSTVSVFQSIEDEQQFFEVAPSFGVNKELGRFVISTGIEIPVYVIGEFTERNIYTQFSESGATISEQEQIIKMDGGIIYGLNHYVNIKTNIFSKFYFFTEFNYGLMFSDIGEEYYSLMTQISPTTSENEFNFEKSIKNTFFSPMQLQFGLGFFFNTSPNAD